MPGSLIGEVIAEFFGEVVIHGIGKLFKLTGVFTRFCFNPKLTFDQAWSKNNNGALGFFVVLFFVTLIFLGIYYL